MSRTTKPRILLVDDDVAFRQTTRELLQNLGHSCVATDGVDEALELLNFQEFDVVVADIRMSGNAQLEFVTYLAQTNKNLPVILVTGFPSVATAVKALDLRLVAYLVKPFEVDELVARIDEALASRATKASLEEAREGLRDLYEKFADVPDRPLDAPARADDSHGGAIGQSRSLENMGKPTEDSLREWREAGLTSRERELLGHLMEGYRTSTIARNLCISPHTVRRHLKSIFLKLEVSSQAELLEKIKPWRGAPQNPA